MIETSSDESVHKMEGKGKGSSMLYIMRCLVVMVIMCMKLGKPKI